MNAAKIVVALAVVFFGGLLIVGGCAWSGYNKAVGLDEGVGSAWAQVENQLQRRFDLIDNLVETVKGVAGQEEKIFLGIAKSREAYFQAKSVGEKAQAAGGLSGALSRLLVLKETYPELRSNESFLTLQGQIEGTENRLAVERKRYNDAVKGLNTFRRKLGGRMFAGLAGVEAAEYFEVEEAAKAAPKVRFGDSAEPAEASPSSES